MLAFALNLALLMDASGGVVPGSSTIGASGLGGTAEFPVRMKLAATEHGDVSVSVQELSSRETVPKRAWRLYEQGLRADDKGKGNEAMDAMRAAVEAAPDFLQAHAALALGWLRAGQLQQAERHLEIAQTLDPYYLPGKEIRGLLLFARGDWGGAADILGALVKSAPCRKTAHYLLSEALRAQGDEDGARKHLETARELARSRSRWAAIADLGSFLPWR